MTYHLEIDNGVLKGKIENKPSMMDCTITGMDEVVMEPGLLRFQRTAGAVSGFELDSGRVKNLKFDKM